MEADEIQTQGCKFQRVGNGRLDSNKVGQKGDEQHVDEEDDGQVKRNVRIGGGGCDIGSLGRLCGWPSSRIVRVSRASGGKDRHSKVLTSKGLRDRRVRLSVQTAIQFYDLQDRLGFDQPSKAVEWLLKEAASSINELPSINTSFPDTPKQFSDEKRSSAGTEQGFDSADLELDGDAEADATYQQQHASLSKSACSSTSETSKGSALSLSRSENRIKARERARERAAEREKEKGNESQVANQSSANPIPQTSFTELLNAGMNGFNNSTATPNCPAVVESNLFHKSARHWSSAPMDYFTPVVVGPSSSRMQHTGFLGQMNPGNSLPQSMPFNIAGDHNQELTHFSIVPDHFVPVASAAGGSDYNLSFTSLSGFNRGTLQSNPPSLLPHLQRFSPIDGSNVPLFIGTAAPNAAVPMENHNQFPHGLDGRLQLFYGGGEGGRHQDQKARGKSRVP